MTKNPHPIFKPKYNIHELSDDIRICDFTCQPDLIIAEKKTRPRSICSRSKNLTHPKHIIFDAEKLGKIGYILLPFLSELRYKRAHFFDLFLTC
jgi:hypothetical protein